MHGTVPLLRIINGGLNPTCSRIPHLTIHIIARQTHSSVHRQPKWATASTRSRSKSRHSSTTSSTPRATPAPHGDPDEQDVHSSSHNAVQTEKIHEQTAGKLTVRRLTSSDGHSLWISVRLKERIRENHPERILFTLIDTYMDQNFVDRIDDETFAQAICALDPDYFIVPFRDIQHYIAPVMETEAKYRFVKSFEERTTTFTSILKSILQSRRNSGCRLSLDIYRHWLRCVATCGSGDLAKTIFYEYMPEDCIAPDLGCYNYLMEAVTWNNAYSSREKYRLRVVRSNINYRSYPVRPPNFAGHGVASFSHPDNEQSVRLQTLKIFNDLVRQGHTGNEATFCHLMIALGREGDVAGVKSVLKSVWNIDIDGLEKHDEEELESPTFYEEGSPLRPSQRLLFTIAHVFGINNQIAVASMLLDYVSRNYNLEISKEIWHHLLEWAYVLFSNVGPWDRKAGNGIGRITAAALESLFAVVQDEPYNLELGIIPLIFRVKLRRHKNVLDATLEDARECLRMLEEDRLQVSIAYDDMRKFMLDKSSTIYEDGIPTVDFLDRRRKIILASLRTECHLQLVIVNMRNIFKNTEWPGSGKEAEWAWRRLPKLLLEFTAFMPDIVPYYTPTGHVRLHGAAQRNETIMATNIYQSTRTSTMRNMLDTFSPRKLQKAASALRTGKLRAYKNSEKKAQGILVKPHDWIAWKEDEGRRKRLSDTEHRHLPYPPAADRLDSGWVPWHGSRSWSNQA